MSTKEDRIAFLEDAIKERMEERDEVVREKEEQEVKLAEFLSMITKKVTEFGKEFYMLGFTSGQRREKTFALNQEYKKLTGELFRIPENTGKYQNQFFVNREAPP